jgi:hypothetical protein
MPECMICEDTYSEQHPLRHMKCNFHHYCEDCFCLALELAIDDEASDPIPCGKKACPRLEFEDVTSILLRFTTVAASRRDDLIQRYTVRLIEYNTINRVICSKSGCFTAELV